MKKVGILTFHNAMNYGAILQAYALQSVLLGMGFDVSIIDYRNEKVESSYRQFTRHSFPLRQPLKLIKCCFDVVYRSNKYFRVRAIVNNMLKLSNRVKSIESKTLEKYDCIVVGSDQLWNSKVTGGYDPFYWGTFSKHATAKILTYAISMNTDQLQESEKEIIKGNLANFSAISVREDTMIHAMQDLSHVKIYKSVDPTFLTEPNFWSSKIKIKNKTDKYVCVYAILEATRVVKAARLFANTKKMPLVVINPLSNSSLFSTNKQPTDPIEFVSIIANSEYVFTSSFHGLAFSVIFNKRVFVYGDQTKNQRMKSLLRMLGMEERFVTFGNKLPTSDIDYKLVNSRLERLRKESVNYLINNIR